MIWNLRWRRISWFWWLVYCPESWLISWIALLYVSQHVECSFWTRFRANQRLSLTSGMRWFRILIRGSDGQRWFDYIYSDFTVRGVPSHLPQKCTWMWCAVVAVWFRCSQELGRRNTPTTRNEPEWPRCFKQCEFWVDFSFKVCVQSWQRCEKPRFWAWWGGEDHGSHEASTGRRHLTVSSGGSQGSRTPAERS